MSTILTIPNLLSALRLAGIPLFLWLLAENHDGWALVVLMVSGITDYLDGLLARRLGQTSRLGAILDPLADRLYVLSTVIAFAVGDVVPLWFAIALPLRDVLLWLLVPFLRMRGYASLPVHFLGKAATAALLYAFPLLLFAHIDTDYATLGAVFGWALALWGLALYWWAGLLYAWQVRQLLAVREPHADAIDGSRRSE